MKTVNFPLTHVPVSLQPCNGIQNSPNLTNTSERQNTGSSPTIVSPEQRRYVTSCSMSHTSGVCRPISKFSPSYLALQSTTSGGNSRSHRKGSFHTFLDGDSHMKTVLIKHTPYQSMFQLKSVDIYRRISLCYEPISCKSKATPLQVWRGPQVSRMLRLPDFKTKGTRKW
jgi:hypothetical protein